MKKKKKTKLGRKLMLLGLLIGASLPGVASADGDYSYGPSFNWSPYTWSGTDTRATSTVTGNFTNVKFDSEAAAEHNSQYFLTLEINNTTDNVGHSGWYSSNLPNVGYDRDDDNGNGYSEETEAYIGSSLVKNLISAGTPYYFYSRWNASSGKTGNFDFIVQRSFYLGEMQTQHYDYLTSNSW